MASSKPNIKQVYTVTFGDIAENHVGMQKIGKLADKGYSIEQLSNLKDRLTAEGLVCEYVDLSAKLPMATPAGVLVIRQGVQYILGEDAKNIMKEHSSLEMDKKAKMRGRLVNKHARYNLCFADIDQEPDYEEGKGRIVAYQHVPLTQRVRERISEWMREDMLNAEANYYYDISKCGIGYHGDSERRKVVAMRMGASMPLYFQWYQRSLPIGDKIRIELNDGDMYVMSEKAVGFDWLKKIIPTLRHATGCDKYTVVKNV